MSEKTDILSLSPEELEIAFSDMGEKKFRARQVFDWLHVKNVRSFEEMSNISKQLRTKLSENFCLKSLNIERKLESKTDNTVKYLYRLDDGNFIETVLMEYNHGYSLCVSSQVGCKMGCNFCASTIAGFVRNLEPSEILLQIYETERDSGKKIDSIVMMGIGEPLDNFSNVVKFLELLSCPEGRNMSLRHVALSTCGVVPKIRKLCELHLGLTLSVSLHASDNSRRSEIMPVNRAYPIEELLSACKDYIKNTGRRITFEYAVINDVNSSEADARKLAELLRGMNCHVNLIPVNNVKERSYTSSMKTVTRFREMLVQRGINATVRRTLGADINAACGQLRRERQENQ